MKPTQRLLTCFFFTSLIAVAYGQPTVVNVIPTVQSAETDQNSEPSIGTNPGNANQSVIGAFRFRNPDGSRACGTPVQPYFLTGNGGTIWNEAFSVPHGDTTMDWSSGGNLYTTVLDTFLGQTMTAGDVYPVPKWLQVPDTSTNGLDVLATEPKVLADDFLCTTSGPITRIVIWGSWLNDDRPGHPCFTLGFWSDVPASGTNASHPGTNLWLQVDTAPWDETLYIDCADERFFDPNSDTIIGRDTEIWRYTFIIPTNQAFVQTAGNVYWLSVSADCFDTNRFTFGWKTTPTNQLDNAVFADLGPGGALPGPEDWEELRRPDTLESLDLSFALEAGPTDQPWITTAHVAGKDRVYVGINDLGNQPPGQNSVVRLTKDASTGPWRTVMLDPVLAGGGDRIPVRVTANGDIVYAAFQRNAGQVIVRRSNNGGDDNFTGNGKNNNPLTPVAAGLTFPRRLGSYQRLGGGGILSIAVDPNDANKVYVAYVDLPAARSPQVHVRVSYDGGETWPAAAEYRPPANSGMPALAVAANGTLGVLYTRFDGINLITRFTQLPAGDLTKPVDTELTHFPEGIPSPIGQPYIGDYEDLQAVGNVFYGTFSASNDPNSSHFPQGVRFQRWFINSITGPQNNAPIPITGANRLADTNGAPISANLDKWIQPPDEDNGLDVKATHPKILADDFLCNSNGPITRITIWGSWLNDNLPHNPCFCLGIWSDVPAAGGAPSHPGVQLWSLCFTNGQYSRDLHNTEDLGEEEYFEQFYDPNLDAIIGTDTEIWRYTFEIPPNQAFIQTNGTIYWLSVKADCFDTNTFLFGWKTTGTNQLDNAVFNDVDANGVPVNDWQELIRPGTSNSLDLAFAVGMIDPRGLSIDPYYFNVLSLPQQITNAIWLQNPDTSTNGLDVLATVPKVLGDDFICNSTGPITDIHVWGSWLNDQPDPNVVFNVAFWSDVPADGTNYSYPGQRLWQRTFFPNDPPRYVANLERTGLSEQFMDPNIPANQNQILGPDTMLFRYDFFVPENDAFIQTNGQTYWLVVQAFNTGSKFGWKTTTNHWRDDAVYGDDPTASGGTVNTVWRPLVYPGRTNSIDLAFALTSTNRPPAVVNTNDLPGLKWLQQPDATPTGLDVQATFGTGSPIVADDFMCRSNGYITDIRIWGSWWYDLVDPNPTFELKFWSDVPRAGAVPSHPGNLLWTHQFPPGTYTNSLFDYNIYFEGFFDPSVTNLIGTDTRVYQYDFSLPPCLAFHQYYSNIYWLSVTAYTTNLFGWKTCITNDHWNDDAVWSPVVAGGNWTDMHYPPNHPYAGLTLDQAFALNTTVVPQPVIAIARSGTNVVISWVNGCSLQSSTSLNGGWADIIGATSPYTNGASGTRRFFRVYAP